MSLLINPVVYFSFQIIMDIVGRQKTLHLATGIVWTGYIFLWALRTFIQKMIAFGFATGCDGAFTMLFILGMNEATRK